MKSIFTFIAGISLFILSSSCCSHKDLAKNDFLACQGIVHVSENGCPFYIEITSSTVDGITVGGKIYPVELKDTFKKKGLKIKFNATVSRAQSPEGCSIDAVAALSDITVIP